MLSVVISCKCVQSFSVESGTMELREYLVSRSDELAIDFVRRELYVNGEIAPIGSRAFEILATLAHSPGQLVSKRDLIASVWPGLSVDDRR